MVEPNQIRDPVRMRVARDYNVVSYRIIVKRLESAVAIRLIPIPGIVLRTSGYKRQEQCLLLETHIQRIDIPVCNRLIKAGEDCYCQLQNTSSLHSYQFGIQSLSTLLRAWKTE